MRLVVLVLAALVLLIQADLWFGRSGVGRVQHLKAELEQQRRSNDAARQRNARWSAEVSDLREGLEMVEEKARFELGMIRPGETLVQYAADPLRAPPAPGATRQNTRKPATPPPARPPVAKP